MVSQKTNEHKCFYLSNISQKKNSTNPFATRYVFFIRIPKQLFWNQCIRWYSMEHLGIIFVPLKCLSGKKHPQPCISLSQQFISKNWHQPILPHWCFFSRNISTTRVLCGICGIFVNLLMGKNQFDVCMHFQPPSSFVYAKEHKMFQECQENVFTSWLLQECQAHQH